MKKSLLISASVTLSLLLASCSTTSSELLKELGDFGQMTGVLSEKTNASIQKASDKSIEAETTAFTLEEEYYIGRGIASSILFHYPLLENQEAVTYVNNITKAMVMNYGANDVYNGYHAAILDSDELNAFATPGGHILVTKGLVKAAGSEDALAAVLAHELGHIQNDHAIRSIREDRKKDAAKAALTASARTFMDMNEIDNPMDILDDSEYDTELDRKLKAKLRELESSFEGMLNSSVDTLVNTGFSQAFEFEADETALQIMADTGYNVKAMEDMLEVLKQNTSAKDTGLGKTHPKPELRLKKIQLLTTSYEETETNPERTARYNRIVETL